MNFKTVDPSTGSDLATYRYLSFAEVDHSLNRLFCFQSKSSVGKAWRDFTFLERQQVLEKVQQELLHRKDELALLIHKEMGKKLSEAKAEIDKSLTLFAYYFSVVPAALQSREVSSQYQKTEIQYIPYGVVFSIMPWNFPVWQVLRFAVPALLAGNVVLLKHSDITAGVGTLLEEIFSVTGKDSPLLLNASVTHEVAAEIIHDPRVRAVTFTGSERGGRAVAAVAGAALKKCVLELGGTDAYLVFEDADIEHAVDQLVRSRFGNSGQSCVAAKRWFVHESVLPDFYSHLEKQWARLELAPLAHQKFQGQVHQQIQNICSHTGVKLLHGGDLPSGAGAFYPATLLEVPLSLHQACRLGTEEIFGPVALVIPFVDETQALELANASVYGLGGGVFTRSIQRQQKILEFLEAGFVAANGFVRSEAGLPFGGVKNSGYGRELGVAGLMEFVYPKTVAYS